MELSVKKGEIVRVMDATASIQVSEVYKVFTFYSDFGYYTQMHNTKKCYGSYYYVDFYLHRSVLVVPMGLFHSVISTLM